MRADVLDDIARQVIEAEAGSERRCGQIPVFAVDQESHVDESVCCREGRRTEVETCDTMTSRRTI